MECDRCGRQIAAGDRFCTGCGVRLQTDDAPAPPPAARPDPPQPPSTERAAEAWDDDPVWAITGAIAQSSPGADPRSGTAPGSEGPDRAVTGTIDAPPVSPVSTPYDFADDDPAPPATPPTTEVATTVVAATDTVQYAPAPAAPPLAEPRGYRTTPVLLLGILGGLATLAAMFVDIVSIRSDVQLLLEGDVPLGFRTGTWILDDLADNLSIAGLIVALSMVSGGVASAFGWRWGSGLAGGAGLAMAGLAALALGLAQFPIDAAHDFAAIPNDQQFTLTITRDLGYWLLVAAGALGVVLFFAAINDAFGDRRRGLNPWIGALGGLATVVAAAGPLLPENTAVFSDNWYVVEGAGEPPALLLAGRLVQLGLFAIGGVVGYLSVRRWGLGLAIGAGLPMVWLGVSVLFELTPNPVGPGFRNPGAEDMHLHGVTIIGISAFAAMVLLAVIGAYDQGVRERR